MRQLLLLVAALVMGCHAESGQSPAGSAFVQEGAQPPPEQIEVQNGAPLPHGYLPVSVTGHFSYFARYYLNKPVGANMTVCHDARTPDGWTEGAPYRTGSCDPANPYVKDVKNITRLY